MENNYIRYVYLLSPIEGGKASIDLIKKHVNFLKDLDIKGKLVMCGPFKDNKGGLVILKVDSYSEALEIAKSDPFVKQGFETFELRTWELSNSENNHMGMG